LNRISAGRLHEIARVLEMPISWFFEDIGTEPPSVALTSSQRMCAERAQFFQTENPKHQEVISLVVRAFVKINCDALPTLGSSKQ